MSKQKRIGAFKENLDSSVGQELYSRMKKEELCRVQKCNHVSETVTEFIYELVSETNPPRTCVYAWLVDAKHTDGDYRYGEGPHYCGLGKKVSWRYLSSSDQCLVTVGFSGPW